MLSRSQWVRIIFLGLLMAIGTLFWRQPTKPPALPRQPPWGLSSSRLISVVIGLSARSETASAFNRDILHDRNQLMLYGLALLLTFLPTELGFLQRILGPTPLTGNQWLLCIGFAIALLLVDEVIKFFLRRRRSQPEV